MRAVLLTLAALSLADPTRAASLGMDEYLGQVRAQNPQLRSLKAQDAAYALAAQEPLVAFSPQLKGELKRYDDQAEPAVDLFSPSRTLAWGWGLGVGKLFGTGTYLEGAFETDRSMIEFPPSPMLPGMLDDQGAKLSLTLNQPLWRNFMAAEVGAALRQAVHGSDAARAGNRYGAQATLLQARSAYVQLATLRQVAAIQAESLDRNSKLLEWTRRKHADNLADKVDVLQVEAALRQVALALAQTRDDEAKAVVRFNLLRGAAAAEAVGGLEPPAASPQLPEPKGERQDLAAAQAALRSSEAMVDAVVQRFTPDLSIFAQVGMNERDPDSAKAFSDAFKLEHPTTVVGLKLTANLDLPLYRKVLAGAKQAQGSGQAQVEAKRQEAGADWQQLRDAWASVKSRLALAAELEALQKEKAEREKVRYRDGRTTNFQVLRFEDDYNLSRIQALQLSAQAAMLDAQARFYNGDDQPW
jgi:outer membrane protein TolC